EGGYFSAEDADSLFEHGKPEHGEGAFYVWTKQEIDAALSDNAEIFHFHYGVQPHGNAPEGSDPQDEFRGKNILIERHTIAETAKHFGNTGILSASRTDSSRGEPVRPAGVSPADPESGQAARDLLKRCREKLFSIRSKRPRPHLDDKIIAAWNGLMISAFARGAQVLADPSYLETATRAGAFIRARLYDESRKFLFRSYRASSGEVAGFADDSAYVVEGLLDLYEASFD